MPTKSPTFQWHHPDLKLSPLETRKFEELLDSGKLPSRYSFCALLLLVIYSHELTPQFDEQDPECWPVGYVSDRELAQSAARALSRSSPSSLAAFAFCFLSALRSFTSSQDEVVIQRLLRSVGPRLDHLHIMLNGVPAGDLDTVSLLVIWPTDSF